MSLLQEIQESVIRERTEIGPILLKLRLLASRLGSEPLEEWVKFESEGYPSEVLLPDYRKIAVTYTGSFSGPFGSGISNAPIPPYLIEKFAGEQWTNYELRQSIAAIDELIESSSSGGGSLQISAANLILLLQGKVYEGYACNAIHGTISRASLAELQHAVRSRLLELTIELEKSIPAAVDIKFGSRESTDSETSDKVTQISQQVIYGNVTSITSSGDGAQFLLAIDTGDTDALKEYLVNSGLEQPDATELVEIISSEEPGDRAVETPRKSIGEYPVMRIMTNAPLPLKAESPTVFADRVGRWYAASVSDGHKKSLGQYLTPVEIALFMARLCDPKKHDQLRVLDPGAGTGVLACALCETLAKQENPPVHIYLEAYETDHNLIQHLGSCLSYLSEWLGNHDISLEFDTKPDDFVMAHAEALDNRPRLMPSLRSNVEPFDIVISNPPYFKIPKSDPRAKAAALVVHGQPNMYALFMAVSAALLKPGGEFVFITPRSYASGPYFRQFRKRFFENMKPEVIHLFDSRRRAFSRDEVLQENVILQARRLDRWTTELNGGTVRISSSTKLDLLSNVVERQAPISEVLDYTTKDKVLRIPVTLQDDSTVQIMRSWSGNLHAYGFEISTGPVIPFRAAAFLSKTGDVLNTHAALLWMQNVTAMRVEWPVEAKGKEQYIIISSTSLPLLVAARNYVLVRRFSAKEQKRRLTAAPILAHDMPSPFLGLENHLNYIHRPGGHMTEEEAYGLAVLFNSSLLDTYFRTYNGNTQVSATELRAMPLPQHDAIVEIGRRAMRAEDITDNIDTSIAKTLGIRLENKEVSQVTYGQS